MLAHRNHPKTTRAPRRPVWPAEISPSHAARDLVAIIVIAVAVWVLAAVVLDIDAAGRDEPATPPAVTATLDGLPTVGEVVDGVRAVGYAHPGDWVEMEVAVVDDTGAVLARTTVSTAGEIDLTPADPGRYRVTIGTESGVETVGEATISAATLVASGWFDHGPGEQLHVTVR